MQAASHEWSETRGARDQAARPATTCLAPRARSSDSSTPPVPARPPTPTTPTAPTPPPPGTAAAANPYRYAASYLDSSTGLYKYGQRYYQPGLNRWTQQDSIERPEDLSQGNRYAYTSDDPVNDTDPTGRAACDVLAFGLGFGVAAAGLFPPFALPGFVIGVVVGGVAASGGCDEPPNQDYGVAEYGYGN